MLAFLALVVVLLAFDAETRIALYITPVLALAAFLGYLASRRGRPAAEAAPAVERTPR
ncbi:hypothetical protein [Saccharopolyspora erythraea]|uniref:hypothetical protein n=1 Tax=Saccharopolyspora erythraea TaxID=1836 RepID=UPI0001D31363|nr:hypothetical protein [Saccharopolyspora erythraea]